MSEFAQHIPETVAPTPVVAIEDQPSRHVFSGRVLGLGSGELVIFGDDGKEYYDC